MIIGGPSLKAGVINALVPLTSSDDGDVDDDVDDDDADDDEVAVTLS